MHSRGIRGNRHRQWTMIDGMILVAATGIGLVGMKEILSPEEIGFWTSASNLRRCGLLAQFPFMSWAVAFLIIGRNRFDGPTWKFTRRPGASACAFGVGGSLFFLILTQGRELITGQPSHTAFLREVSETFPLSGLVILICWASQIATGAWRLGPDWVDRLGRCLGTAWVILALGEFLGI